VCLAVRLSNYPSVNFYIFNFFSRTTGPILTILGTNHPGGEVYSNEGDSSSPMGNNSDFKSKNTLKRLKNLLQNQLAKFNQTWYKLSMDEGNTTLFK
jgi:hypothetical protein